MTTVARAPQISDNDRLGMTLFLAAVLHGIVILGITFSIASPADSEVLPTLDVILVQTHNPSEAEDAKYLAQVSQQGGGNSEEQSRPTDLFTAPTLSKNPGVAMATSEQQQASQQQVEKVAMLHQDDSSYRIDTDQEKQNPDDTTRLDRQNQNQNIKQARLAQELSTQIQQLSDTTRTKYLNSSTREFAPAAYMRQWSNRVERIGNLNYPEEAKRKQLYGNLVLHVAVRADGSVERIRVVHPSGSEILDEAAVRIVELAAPFAPFPPDIRQETDVLDITRTWQFLSSNRLGWEH